MENTLIESLARTLRELTKQNGRQCHGDDETGWRYYVDDARAVLEAIREPSAAMLSEKALFWDFLQVGDEPEQNVYHDREEALHIWRAMIDAALAEGQ